MADGVQISQLPAATTLRGGELVPIVQDGVTKQTTTDAIQGNNYLRPQMFGPCGNGDADEDTTAWQAAVNAASASGTPIRASGTYYLKPQPPIVCYQWEMSTTDNYFGQARPMYYAVSLSSNVTIYGDNLCFIPAPMDVAPISTSRIVLFGVPMNLDRGSYANITFVGVTFKFSAVKFSSPSAVYTFIYAVGGSGITNLSLRGCVFTNPNSADFPATANRGRGVLLENSDQFGVSGCRFLNNTQGIFTHYLYNVLVTDCFFTGMPEALDFDGPADDVQISNLQFVDMIGSEAQCIDYGGGARWTITNIDAKNTGNIFAVYIKAFEWPDYAQFIANNGGPVPYDQCEIIPVPEDISIKGVRGYHAGFDDHGAPTRTIMVGAIRASDYGDIWGWGTYRTDAPLGPRRVTIEDVYLEGCANVQANDCEDLIIRGLTMIDTVSDLDDNTNSAALRLRQATASAGLTAVTRITGIIEDVTLINSQSMGLIAYVPGDLSFDNITVNGFNTNGGTSSIYGLSIVNAGTKGCTINLGNISVTGGPTGSTAVRITGANPIVTAPAINQTGAWNVHPGSGATFLITDSIRPYLGRLRYSKQIGWNTVAQGTQRVPMEFQIQDYRLIPYFVVTPDTAIVGNATNYTRATLRHQNNSVVTTVGSVDLDAASHAALAQLPMTGSGFFDGSEIIPTGDTLDLTFLRLGSGSSSTTGVLFLTWREVVFTQHPSSQT